MSLHPLRGKPAPLDKIINVPSLISDYYTLMPQAPVAFGTSGHRGSAVRASFNEGHVASVALAVIEYRKKQGYKGPLYLGFDTHGLSEPAWRTCLEILAANGVQTIISKGREFSPTPVISFMILEHNRENPGVQADGLIITPSHNPPQDGGIKYNPPHGGPADVDVTDWVQNRANEIMPNFKGIKRLDFKKALKSKYVKEEDFMTPFIEGLGEVVDFDAIRSAELKLGADPLGGSGVHYWNRIAERWKINIDVVNPKVDASFAFMPLDSDGEIRMDCSSPFAMANLLALGLKYDLAFGNDPDFDRHGIVSGGNLMNPNHYLATSINYLLENRPDWKPGVKIGKTLVSSSIIDRVVKGAGRELYETPVGFKWFVPGLLSSDLAFGGEESAGASFLRRNGKPWTTDKDGFCMALLSAEIMAKTGRAPHEIYFTLTQKYGSTNYERVDSPITDKEKDILSHINPNKLTGKALGGKKVQSAWLKAPGNDASIGGVKVILEDGSWFAMRPSGTEPKMKLYVESFSGEELKKKIIAEAPALIFGA
ncbi:MAG: phosphoglucomutase, alpha-D-glucose phosphate-specific [Deltaproteobacteria bacterium]|jgi:phosphoglucomutase|nr:phosphoglucomutase, alpha-D-glucose phosphate-specific [Deltaproteobacteria bacterium]